MAALGDTTLEQLHGLAHERGEIARLPGRHQIGVNNDFPVLVERAGLDQFISHRRITGGAPPRRRPALTRICGPWQMAATGLLRAKKFWRSQGLASFLTAAGAAPPGRINTP